MTPFMRCFFVAMKYSDELTVEICKYLQAGNNIEDSCALANISKETYYTWKKTHSDFSDAIKKAELRCKARNIAIIQKAAEESWQASAWWLERKYKDEFALKNITEHQGASGQPLSIKVVLYGQTDSLFTYISEQLRSQQFKSPSLNGDARTAPISSSQLAQEGKKNDIGNKSVDKMGS